MAHNKTTKCDICGLDIRNNNWKRHRDSCTGNSRPKIRGIDFDPNWGYAAGVRSAWNKGSGQPKAVTEFTGTHGGYRPGAGRSKKFKVTDSFGRPVTLQSSYEHAVFEILCELGIRWTRPTALKYNGRNYFADFYLVDYHIWLDPKNNYKALQDAKKIEDVCQQNGVRVYVLLEKHIHKNHIAWLAESVLAAP